MSDEPQAVMEMPRYKCHKIVHALKIKEVNGAVVTPEDERYAPVRLDDAFISKHNPHAGGYIVVYPDGYRSFSPAEAFESGYTRI